MSPWHSAPRHPQSHGKNERFNRTRDLEVPQRQSFENLPDAQRAFDAWCERYNRHRPHDALKLAVPAERHGPSPKAFRKEIEPLDHATDDIVRSVDANGRFSFVDRQIEDSKALAGKCMRSGPPTRTVSTTWSSAMSCSSPSTSIDKQG